MSSTPLPTSNGPEPAPGWLADILGAPIPAEGGEVTAHGIKLVMRSGILRSENQLSDSQAQTRDSFGFIWGGTDRFQSEASLEFLADWYRSNYGAVEKRGLVGRISRTAPSR